MRNAILAMALLWGTGASAAEIGDFTLEAGLLGGAAQGLDQLVGHVGLLQEIEGAPAHGFDSHGHVPVAGNEDNLGCQSALAH